MSVEKSVNFDFFEITPRDDVDFNEKKFKKLELTSSQKSSMNLLISQLPVLVSAETLSHAYAIKFPDGITGTLMKYKNGGLGTPIQGTDGKIVGHASLHDLSTQTILLNAFSVMSIATGEYFLSQINQKFEMINQKIDKIMDFLYGDKRAELMAEISFVQYAYRNYQSIMLHDEQRISTIVGLQASRKIAMKDIEFYLHDLNTKSDLHPKAFSEFEKVSDDAFSIHQSLDLSIQLYVLSCVMEAYYSQNSDEDYLNALKEEMLYYINKCDRRILSGFSKLNGTLATYKPSPVNKIDTVPLTKSFSGIIDKLTNGDETQMQKMVTSSLNAASSSNEYFVNKNGSVYMSCAV